MRPGVFDVRASAFCSTSALISDDLPTLERPAKAISIGPSGGRNFIAGTPRMRSTIARKCRRRSRFRLQSRSWQALPGRMARGGQGEESCCSGVDHQRPLQARRTFVHSHPHPVAHVKEPDLNSDRALTPRWSQATRRWPTVSSQSAEAVNPGDGAADLCGRPRWRSRRKVRPG